METLNHYSGVILNKDEGIMFYNQHVRQKAHIVLKNPLWDLLHVYLYSNRYLYVLYMVIYSL